MFCLFLNLYFFNEPFALGKQNFFAFALMFQVCIIYFVTGIVKSEYQVWHDGTALYHVLRLDEFAGSTWNYWLTDSELFVKAGTYGTLIFEITFPLFVLFRFTKYIILLFGIAFHTCIWLFIKIDVFPWIMIAPYFVFISDQEYHALHRFLLQKFKFKTVSDFLFFSCSCMRHPSRKHNLPRAQAII